MVPVSSPTRHSAIRAWRSCEETGLDSSTLTVRVWPLVPGLSCSTLVNTGFLRPGLAVPAVGFCGSSGGVAIGEERAVMANPNRSLKDVGGDVEPLDRSIHRPRDFLSACVGVFWSNLEARVSG